MSPSPPHPDIDVIDDDAWARGFFEAMLAGTLGSEAFEQAVHRRWARQQIIAQAPKTAAWLEGLTHTMPPVDAGYAAAEPQLGFRSLWLAGEAGLPGAIHIQAPPEPAGVAQMDALNRPPHQHDSGRIAVITAGAAVFHVQAEDGGDAVVFDCAVQAGDMVFWPAWTAHTFDAREGFSLVSAMALYVPAGADGFLFPVDANLCDRPRRPYGARHRP